jgi:hypothetical protein
MGFSPGEESLDDGVAAQTIEAQPVFGQIEPSRGQVRPRAEQHQAEDMANIGCTVQEVGSIQRRERNSVREKTDIVCRDAAASTTKRFPLRSARRMVGILVI